MSDRNDNSNNTNTQSVRNRKTSKTTVNKKSFALNKCETHLEEEMQRNDCDIQRDQQICGTTTANTTTNASLTNDDYQTKRKSEDSITSDNTTTDDYNNNNNEINLEEMQCKDDENSHHSSNDDNGSQSDSQTNNIRLQNNKSNKNLVNFETKLKDSFSADENSSLKATADKKVKVFTDSFFLINQIKFYSNY